jgi:RNA polymerase sigma-70 factor (ECF subfamily)
MDDKQLVDNLIQGDEKSFRMMVNEYRQTVVNVCFRIMLNTEDAEDIAQEVFVEVFFSIKKFRGASKLSTWIHRIAVSKCLDEIKIRNRKKRIAMFGKTTGLDEVVHWLSGNDFADNHIIHSEEMEKLNIALNKLPEKQRVALALSKIEGLSNTEISEILEKSVSSIDSLVFRAKQNLLINLNTNSKVFNKKKL